MEALRQRIITGQSRVQSEKWLTLFELDLERRFDRNPFGFPKEIHATENPIRPR